MKIVAGLGTIDDYEAFAQAGADELFTGFVPYEWQIEHEHKTPLNRREVSYSNVNIGSESELEILAEKTEKRGVPVTIAFNGLNYRPDQYPIIENIIEKCRDKGFKNIIIADLGLLIHAQRSGLCSGMNIHISGEFGEMNSLLIGRLRKLGAGRIIYHRGISLDDLRIMTHKNPGIEHEVFFMNENCHFTGAYCNSLHNDEMVPVCRIPYELRGTVTGFLNGGFQSPSELSLRVDAQRFREEDDFGVPDRTPMLDRARIEFHSRCSGPDYCEGMDGCGMCYLKKLESAGATHLKIAGRGDSTEHMITLIKTAKQVLLLNDLIKDEEEFIDYVKKRLMKRKCSGRCYFR